MHDCLSLTCPQLLQKRNKGHDYAQLVQQWGKEGADHLLYIEDLERQKNLRQASFGGWSVEKCACLPNDGSHGSLSMMQVRRRHSAASPRPPCPQPDDQGGLGSCESPR